MSRYTKFRFLIEYALLRSIIGLVRLLPLNMAVSISASAWGFIAPKLRRHKRALENLERAYPEKTPEERERIAIEMWKNLGRVMAETMLLDRILKQPERVELVDDFVTKRYAGKMGSAICVSLHTGNWELAVWPMVLAGIKGAAVYRLVNNPYVDEYIRNQRKALYPDGMFAKAGGMKAGQETARQTGNYVKHGGRLSIVNDLYDRQGFEVPFFGHMARTNPFPAILARRSGSRIWMGRCIRINNETRFKVEIKELRVPRTDNNRADIEEIMTNMQKQFEEWIREYPEQWMWSNRRWK